MARMVPLGAEKFKQDVQDGQDFGTTEKTSFIL
jgi:hypothetical protein